MPAGTQVGQGRARIGSLLKLCRWIALTLTGVLLGAAVVHWLTQGEARQDRGTGGAVRTPEVAFVPTLQSAHYAVASTADAGQTEQVVRAVEQLREAYIAFLPAVRAQREDGQKLKLRLYRNQAEFKANNRSSPWAEAYYQTPVCHAYYSVGERNPYHWMLHEATHQLNRELAGFPRVRWSDEGLASYFGASKLLDGKLVPGTIDGNAYPIWWLSSLALSGDLTNDIAKGRIIPLRAVIDGSGPPIGQRVNLYYIEFWSLSHFLFHYNGGQYADGYRRLLGGGGGIVEFEKAIGPLDRVQTQWYGYLREMSSRVH